jgi:hypothetical protein
MMPADLAQYDGAILKDGRDPAPRHFLGLARQQASLKLSDASLMPPSRIWGKRPKCDPIRDRQHQINTAHYLYAHRRQGAAVQYLHHFYPAQTKARPW